MITIALVNSKGGVGKTTLTAALAIEAAKEMVDNPPRPARVALVDLDPQRSLVKWCDGRGDDNPKLLEGCDDAADAMDRLAYMGCEYAFFDSPPAFLNVIEGCIESADLIILPLRASMLDVAASEDAYVMAKEAGTATMMVLNDVHPNEGVVTATHDWLTENNIELAKTMIHHRVSHTYAMMAGLSAAEKVNGKVDKGAKTELANLWAEVRDAAIHAHEKRAEAAE
jgi:chromosome partitioning protein